MSTCYFHVDFDGFCAAAIVKKADPNAYTVPINYDQELKKDKIKKGERVYVVDFSFSPEDMKWLADNTDLVWIDHHESSMIEVIPVIGDDVKGIRDIKYSGCELSWMYFFPNEPMPRAVTLIGRYDVWQHDAQLHIVEFNRGLTAYDIFPSVYNKGVFELWDRIFFDKDLMREILEKGTFLWEKEVAANRRAVKSLAFPVDFHGYKALAVNMGIVDSYLFSSIENPEQYDMFIGFYRHARGHWKVSLRETPSTKIHLGKFAAEHYKGGGGHIGAAGFCVKTIDELPFRDKL